MDPSNGVITCFFNFTLCFKLIYDAYMYTCFTSAKLEKYKSEPGGVFTPAENTPQ